MFSGAEGSGVLVVCWFLVLVVLMVVMALRIMGLILLLLLATQKSCIV